MTDTSADLYKQLKRGPAFIMLGQDYLRLETGTDPFLAEISRKYGPSDPPAKSYKDIWKGTVGDNPEVSMAWLRNLSDRLSVPSWLSTVAGFQWSGVYTSAFDNVWKRAFQTSWRELHAIFSDAVVPIDPRNKLRLHTTYLSGSVTRSDYLERPPLTRHEWLDRKPIATRLAGRLPELITPLGLLMIEGYAGSRDWLAPEDLFAILNTLSPGQVHLFSAIDSVVDDDLQALISRGKLVLHEESLATWLSRGDAAGWIKLGERPDDEQHGRRVALGDRTVSVPPEIWNRISVSAQVLDEAAILPPLSLSREAHYAEFRNFLSDVSLRPIWSGYARDFSFHREYEDDLFAAVEKNLRSAEQRREPVILYGQTGTGKTVALGALAYRIRKEGRYPVLFIERKPQSPNRYDLDAFCKWAEDNGAPASLIIWDGMTDTDSYYDLVKYLAGRGRKVVVVGSCYRSAITPSTLNDSRKNHVEAPQHLSRDETKEFVEFLDRVESGLGATLQTKLEQQDDYFLVALYRMLPTTRSGIRAGVYSEVNFTEQQIEAWARSSQLDPQLTSALGIALLKANLITRADLEENHKEVEISGERFSEYQELIGLIMVPGRFGLKVPIELVMRALGRDHWLNFASLLRDLDLFRTTEDGAGNLLIGPRHPLEAQLFVHARFGQPGIELAFAKKLLMGLRPGDWRDNTTEVQFAVDLVRNMGPNGVAKDYFSRHFDELSAVLTFLREERGVINPRLMLQEASILREYIVDQSISHGGSTEAADALESAASILRHALELIGNDNRYGMIKSFILVELGSTLASMSRNMLDSSGSIGSSVQYYRAARTELLRALSVDPDNYHPIDVMAWASRDILNSSGLTPRDRAEAQADALHMLDSVTPEDLSPTQQALFHQRSMELGPLLDRPDIAENAFQSLATQGSAAGYYLRAKSMTGKVPQDQVLSSEMRERCRTGAQYLQDNRAAISLDGRCLTLLLRLWWMAKTGRPMFLGERQTVPFSRSDWLYCLDIVRSISELGELYVTPSLRFIEALAVFHIDGLGAAIELFRGLDRDVLGRRRIIRSYLASSENGSPLLFSGTVTSFNGQHRGEIYIDELHHRVTIFPVDFGRPDIRQGETLSSFHLAFNFIGPIADPVSYAKDHIEGGL